MFPWKARCLLWRSISDEEWAQAQSECVLQWTSKFVCFRNMIALFKEIKSLMQMQVLLWYGTTALNHADGGPEATLWRNEHHYISVSEHLNSVIADLDSSALSQSSSHIADTARSVNDILSIHKEIVSSSSIQYTWKKGSSFHRAESLLSTLVSTADGMNLKYLLTARFRKKNRRTDKLTI